MSDTSQVSEQDFVKLLAATVKLTMAMQSQMRGDNERAAAKLNEAIGRLTDIYEEMATKLEIDDE